MDVRPVLLATDLTDTTAAAGRVALDHARTRGAPLVVLHVVGSAQLDPAPIAAHRYRLHEPEDAARDLVADLERERLTAIRDWFHEVVGDPDGVSASYELAFGDLPEVVHAVADELGADEVVVGARAGLVGRKLSRLISAATRPVVVVPEGA